MTCKNKNKRPSDKVVKGSFGWAKADLRDLRPAAQRAEEGFGGGEKWWQFLDCCTATRILPEDLQRVTLPNMVSLVSLDAWEQSSSTHQLIK
jgi:hypothetical protein